MKLPLFPLRTVLFPGMPLPLHVFEPRYREMINYCVKHQSPFGVVLIHSGKEVGGPAEPHLVGTSAIISNVERLPDGRMDVETIGHERFQILALHHDEAYLTGTVMPYPLGGLTGPKAKQAALSLLPWLTRYLTLLGQAAGSPFNREQLPNEPAAIAYLAAIVAQIPPPEKQELLAASTALDLLEQERNIYRREVSLLHVLLTSPQSQSDPTFSPN